MDRDSIDEGQLDLDELESSPGLGRRAFLIGGLAAGAALSAPVNYAALARGKRLPLAKEVRFPQGIASGFPYPRGTILWTRVEGIKKSARLKVEVAKDRHFKNVVIEKTATARADRDFTARTRVKGLKPHHEYFYRFHTEHSHSPVGRFRTGPPQGLAAAPEDRLLLVPAVPARVLQRPGRFGQRGRRPRPLPWRLHL